MEDILIKDEIIKRKIYRACPFNEGYAFVYVETIDNNDGEWIIIDENGNQVSNNKIGKTYSENNTFHEGYAVVLESAFTECSYEKVINPNIDCENGYYHANGKRDCSCKKIYSTYRYINSSGEKVSEEYEKARDFHEGIAWAYTSRNWIPLSYNFEPKFIIPNIERTHNYKEGICFIKQQGQNFRAINDKGEPAFEGEFEEISDFSCGLSSVKQLGTDYWVIIDRNGKIVSDKKYKYKVEFNSNGYAIAIDYDNEDRKSYLINRNFERVSKDYDYICILENGYILSKKDNKIYILDKNINVISSIANPFNMIKVKRSSNKYNKNNLIFLEQKERTYCIRPDGSYVDSSNEIGSFSYNNLAPENRFNNPTRGSYIDENGRIKISTVPMYQSTIRTPNEEKIVYGVNEQELTLNKIKALEELKKHQVKLALKEETNSCRQLLENAQKYLALELGLEKIINSLVHSVEENKPFQKEKKY